MDAKNLPNANNLDDLEVIGVSADGKGHKINKANLEKVFKQSQFYSESNYLTSGVLFTTNNGYSGIGNAFAGQTNILDPHNEQSGGATQLEGHYNLQTAGKRGVLLDYSFNEPYYILGSKIVSRNKQIYRVGQCYIELLFDSKVVYTTAKGQGETSFNPIKANQFRFAFDSNSTDGYTTFNFIGLKMLVEKTGAFKISDITYISK